MSKGWAWCRLKDICGFLSRGKSPVYSDKCREYPVFAQKCNLKEGGISLEKSLFLDPTTLSKWPEYYKLQDGDILVNSTGTGTVGRTRLFNSNCLGDYPFVVPDSHVSVIRTWETIYSEYILAVLSSEYGKHYIEENLAGSTNQKELYIGVLEDFLIPIPPRNEQHSIAERIDSFNEAINQIDETEGRLNEVISAARSNILNHAISGKLVSQNPSDEPAIELLKRINPAFKPSDNLHYVECPSGWAVTQMKSIIDLLSGRDLDNSLCNTEGYGEPYLVGASCIDNGHINIYRWTENPEVISKKGDVLLSCKGTVGEVVLNTFGDIHIARQFMAIRSKAPQCILPDYLVIFIKASMATLKKAARGIIPGISRNDILELTVMIPPIEEQQRILSRIVDLNQSISQIVFNTSD